MPVIKRSKLERQYLWCDNCQRASIAPKEEYTVIGGSKNFCQDCEPIDYTGKAGATK